MYENKISARQLRRMIFIETFGAGALSIPAFACYKEQNGFWSLIFYGVFLAGTIAFFIIFSGKISEVRQVWQGMQISMFQKCKQGLNL